jgi:microsomal dipeptidase-like Zn-dependent dipeptidase
LNAKELEEIRKSLSHVRAEIDNLQAPGEDAKKTQRPEAEQVMAFTLPLREEDGKGRLKIFYSKRKKGGADEGFKMSLFLEMENTGPVRTDFFLLNKKLKITFYLIDHRIENIILEQAMP